MKTTKLVMLVMTIAVALFILIPNLSWAADDGATIYKAKCAMCHGADAAGKPAAKIPSLVSDDLKKASDDDLAKDITEKAKHPATVKSLCARSGKDGCFVHSQSAEIAIAVPLGLASLSRDKFVGHRLKKA